MTPAAQRLAIAGALGLEVLGDGELTPTGILLVRGADWYVQQDWLADLNAMHQIEKVLTQSERVDYSNALAKICGIQFEKLFATAAQRAEGWLRAKCLWKD